MGENEKRTTNQQSPKGSYKHTADPQFVRDVERCESTIGLALRRIMDARGVTAADVAKIMGLSPSAVRHRLYGARHMRASEAVALANALDVDVRYLLDPEFTEQD